VNLGIYAGAIMAGVAADNMRRVQIGGVIKPAALLTLDDLDQRSVAFRYASGLKASFISDLGGFDNTTAAQRELAQRASILGAMCEDAETQWLKGEPLDRNAYLATVNCQKRVLTEIGMERRQKDVTPALGQYLALKANSKYESEPLSSPSDDAGIADDPQDGE
jgi:hypothetical protein